ncbi:uncharacterized protein Z520_03746 [Fonsecaea multimorphosa CBS 102226]|uniref:BZIP domain-containing protein n=1 Tax=Fonsecaea multimorphosa CBS 102226 TaxID=1442371 RepID=A0A0D2HDU1_9EURO|nr:uncharacterized protein Z520_03746 [Fonsecaea multimorphosa CBS 102226]KIY00061.1 hypothetical protein Z520_03746 [Fonsecaea multimorphosa CBS 102226]
MDAPSTGVLYFLHAYTFWKPCGEVVPNLPVPLWGLNSDWAKARLGGGGLIRHRLRNSTIDDLRNAHNFSLFIHRPVRRNPTEGQSQFLKPGMCCKDSASAPRCKDAARDKERHKSAITEARRLQNRRAQRAFRERQRAKNRSLPSTTLKLLAPYPCQVKGGVTIRSFKTETSDRPQSVTGPETLTLSCPYQEVRCAVQDQQRPSSRGDKNAPFTFSSPQTLLPIHQSFVPKHKTPFSELLDFVRNRPIAALWPHGVTATLAACLFNARALGIDIDRIMDPQYMSPFYRASLSPILLAGSSVQLESHDSVTNPQVASPILLRPCSAQVVFPHHVCLDMLPLPALRETAVMCYVRAQQGGVDGVARGLSRLQEFKKDVYIMQGVRFRGMGELLEGEYIMYDESERHCGHPWESGSWAVAPWFVRKWTYG